MQKWQRRDMMRNVLLDRIDYKIDKTARGVWKRFLYPSGEYYAEFTSHATYLGMPVIHYTRGICPETGRRKMAKGIIAVGRLALGVVAIGQASFGLLALGQLAVGVLFGLGQATTGALAIGQLAIGFQMAIGQFAAAPTAIGQIAVGEHVLAQIGFGKYVWSPEREDPEAVRYFQALLERLRI
jgi:hypothetical protein